MPPYLRFVNLYSLLVLPEAGFAFLAWRLLRTDASWFWWVILLACAVATWTVPLWLRLKIARADSPDEIERCLRRGKASLVHLYSDY